ncbi:NINE protein [Brotaphodocola sp.]|uniref:TM2 domain-containing protein n=1 Tax=Brotaphodocola sp. TaxID=3073577 RepID=UPI003D7F01DA
MENKQKYCKHCGQLIDADCIVCPKCGKQVEELKNSNSSIVINNSSSSNSTAFASSAAFYGRPKNKWIAFFLCLFTICGHKFYEGKIGMGILYLCTGGLCGIGWIIDLIALLMKPNPYYV